ncbi:glycosyltransferase family 4 protein [Laspinema sp. D1]|uniref:glycosyltransferase family 4 protein n=1 Tax=Laspinema palackyanum TaxID=3231601 RepID=UPI00346BB3DE|nr:glycosyltransferase family 4 protein [Laspinema sp. D2b]
MKILMISCTFPYPPTLGGTHVRTFNLMKYLSQHHHVILVTQRSPDVTDAEVERLRDWVQDVAIFPPPGASAGQGSLGKVKRFAKFLSQGTPPNVLSRYSPKMQHWVDHYVESVMAKGQNSEFAITCEHSVNEIYVRPEWSKAIASVVDIHSSVYGTCRQLLETNTSENTLRDRLQLPLLQKYEQRYCSKFSGVVVTTTDDQQQIKDLNPDAKISVIPNGVDLEMFPVREMDPGGHRLAFVGAMDILANIDAVRFLALEVFPLIRLRYPDATLALVGSRPVAEVQELANQPGVTVTGQVPSIAEYLHQATVCVIPMRTGYGIKNKTLEAMAAGTPVVASDRGLEGLTVDGPNVPLRALRANEVNEYVTEIGRLFEDRRLRDQLSVNARRLVERDYTWEVAGSRYSSLLSELSASKS